MSLDTQTINNQRAYASLKVGLSILRRADVSGVSFLGLYTKHRLSACHLSGEFYI